MDYIIFGFGAGATLTLVGWAFREWGSRLRDRSSSGEDVVLSGHELVDRMAWQRFCRSCGTVLTIVGLLVLLATIIATALMLSNTTGATIVLATMAVCVVATLAWLGLFLHRFGARGILRPKPAPEVRAAEERRGDTAATHPFVGPPVPDEASVAVAVQPPRANEMALRGGEETKARDQFLDDDGPMETEQETAEPAEDVSASGRSESEGDPDDDAPPTGAVSASEDVAAGAADSPVSATGRRRIVMVPARKEDPERQPAQDDSDPANVAALDSVLAHREHEDSNDEDQPQSGNDPDSDAERAEEVEGPPSSGRAEAVRKLRQRRNRRLARGSSGPDQG